ncbi:MAG TPA: nucleotidyl transferase AbiEii/AbiGii toxin family protein [Puia sp.]|nr:nucleotidyl transferase AbiEii/AbiGii toxin family protein [Puia sp.]
MIREHCFQLEWIERLRAQEEYQKINPPLVEKMIHALSLVQQLQVHGLDFIFKGGTSLILLLAQANRFSVDVDIITQAGREDIERLLNRMVQSTPFYRWELDAHRSYKPGVPKAHYKLEYTSNFIKAGNTILLDILFEKPHYPEIQELPIQSHWIETETLISVKLPTIEAITGDKLTAFAPNTTGIQYGKEKELEIIKQLFDLGHLFEQVKAVDIVAASYDAFVQQELAYRGLELPPRDVLWDTIHTCRIIGFRDSNKKDPDRYRFMDLRTGIQNFSNHLISGYFRIDQAVTASAKVAYLCARLMVEDYTPLQRYAGQDVQTLNIAHPEWNVLNKLKRLPDQSAFFYWYECLKVLEQKGFSLN